MLEAMFKDIPKTQPDKKKKAKKEEVKDEEQISKKEAARIRKEELKNGFKYSLTALRDTFFLQALPPRQVCLLLSCPSTLCWALDTSTRSN